MSRYQCFFPKTEVVFGPGLLERLQAFRGQKAGIVTDAFMAKSGALDRVRGGLAGCELAVFDEVVPEPSVETVSAGVRLFAEFGPDVVVALGGGSPIDAAKAVVAVLREMWPERKIPFVAIPTTSGTGSEVTSFAVISDPAKGKKFPLVSPDLVPDVALLDAELVRTAPPKVTADTGMDVITHAIEAIVSTGASDFSDAFAEKALELAFLHLPGAFQDGDNMVAREAMHHASCMAGLAFSASGLGLNHGLAHAIGGLMHVVHGRINAMLMPLVISFNAGFWAGANVPDALLPAAKKYARIAGKVGLDAPAARAGTTALVRQISALNARFGIPATLRQMGVDMDLYSRNEGRLIEAALDDACTASNPRKPTRSDVSALLRAIGG